MTAINTKKIQRQVPLIKGQSISMGEAGFPAHVHTGALCEILPVNYRDRAAALGSALAFISQILQEKDGPVIWCQLRDPDRLHLHAPGLAAFGLDPSCITKVTLASEKDFLWAMEEAVTSKAVVGVVGVLWAEKLYDFTASKRLRLRAHESDIPVLMVRSHRANGSTAADLRYSVSSHRSHTPFVKKRTFNRIGDPEWQLDLTKSRRFKPGMHHVRWNHETLRLGVATELVDRALWSPVEPAHSLKQTG